MTILDPVHCPRYAARLMTGLTVAPSPFWMRRRLQMAGLRAINNLVDVTNYVLLEFGQPLHAFDFERLRNGEIVVRLPKSGERRFTTLDGVERDLDPETLLICDAEGPVALAGIMGGSIPRSPGPPPRCCWKAPISIPAPSAGPPSAWGSAPRPPTGSSGGWTPTG